MSTEQVTKCDVCEIYKREVNHWWRIWIAEDAFCCAPFASTTADPEAKDVCGVEHAQQMFNRYLATGTLEKQK
jgi:hypothetical protein